MKLSCEEVFGPVVGVAPFDGPEEALAPPSPKPCRSAFRPGPRPLAWIAPSSGARPALRRRAHHETPTFRADQMPYGGVKDSGNTARARPTR